MLQIPPLLQSMSMAPLMVSNAGICKGGLYDGVSSWMAVNLDGHIRMMTMIIVSRGGGCLLLLFVTFVRAHFMVDGH